MKHQSADPSVNWQAATLASLAAVLLHVATPAHSMAAGETTRAGRCAILQKQLAEQIGHHVGSGRSAAAASLAAKGKKLCASGKQAQGLRAYAKALQILGVQPVDLK